MGTPHIVTGIVLKNYDIGEADRFCIVFTKELGVIQIRANGVRKLKSKLGPYFLPSQLIEISIYKSKNSTIAQSATLRTMHVLGDIERIQLLQPIVELCILLLPEEQILPEIFTPLEYLFELPTLTSHTVLACILHCLYALGYVPAALHESIANVCTTEEQDYIATCFMHNWHTVSNPPPELKKRLLTWVQNIIKREAHREVKSFYLLQ